MKEQKPARARYHIRPAAAGLTMIWLLLTCSSSVALEQTVARTTKTSQPVNVGGHMRSDKNCKGTNLPAVSLTVPPQHGTVCAEITMMMSFRSLLDPPLYPHCKGQKMRGIRVVYVSAPGFAGKDLFEYKIEFPKLEVHRKVNMTVNAATVPSFMNKPIVEAPLNPQQPGPVPVCSPLIS